MQPIAFKNQNHILACKTDLFAAILFFLLDIMQRNGKLILSYSVIGYGDNYF